MAAPKLEVLLFSFEEDTGSREDMSVFYAEPLAVLATTQDRDVIAAIIEDHISYSSADESYDRDFDRDKLLEKILEAGYSASWQKIEVFCNE